MNIFHYMMTHSITEALGITNRSFEFGFTYESITLIVDASDPENIQTSQFTQKVVQDQNTQKIVMFDERDDVLIGSSYVIADDFSSMVAM